MGRVQSAEPGVGSKLAARWRAPRGRWRDPLRVGVAQVVDPISIAINPGPASRPVHLVGVGDAVGPVEMSTTATISPMASLSSPSRFTAALWEWIQDSQLFVMETASAMISWCAGRACPVA